MTDFNTSSKLQHAMSIWRGLSLFYLTNISILCLEITIWIDTSQVITIFVGSSYSVCKVLDLTISHNTDTICQMKIGRAHVLNSSHANISYAVFCLKKKRRGMWQ